MRRAKRWGLCVAVLGVLATPGWSVKFSPLSTDDIDGVTFSGTCLDKQWSVNPRGALELMMTAGSDDACTATLPLQDVVKLRHIPGLSFSARTTEPGSQLQIEVQETDDASQAVRSPRYEIDTRWHRERLIFSRLQEDWHPRQIAVIRFIAAPTHDRQAVHQLLIRDIRWTGLRAENVIPDSLSHPPAAPVPDVASSAASENSGVATGKSISASHRRHAREMLPLGIITAGLMLFAFPAWHRRKTPIPGNLSPLYEINTRTWKSERDDDGVLHVGGFNRITSADLRSIKESGFNAVWIMGIWEIGPKVRDISRRYGDDFAGSPFAIHDYCVSEELGSDQDFQNLVDRAHAAGLGVVLDFVPNHMGLDSSWLNDHPEYFIHKPLDAQEKWLPDAELETRYPGYYAYRTPSYPENGTRVPKTIMVAYGRDPYFYPWIDTAQLDYAEPGLRRRMIDVLTTMAKRVDGVRCDMAMLVLREQVKIHRHPEMSWEEFNRWMPEEFWPEAIRCAKRANPRFVFMAETYWSMEGFLQQLGFDYTYNKPLYEAICGAFHNGHAEGLMNFIRLVGTDFLRKSVNFLENHDEERAMNSLGDERQRGAAVLLATLPGLALIHQGQMEGKRERLPVQRAVPLQDEPVNTSLRDYYQLLLRKTSSPLFRTGRLIPLYSNNPALVTYARVDDLSGALIIVNASGSVQKGSVFLMPGLRLKAGVTYHMTDLFYDLKRSEIKQQSSVRPEYDFPASRLISQGLYVELQPFDAHIFMFHGPQSHPVRHYAKSILRELNIQWPLPRRARTFIGPTLTRAGDAGPLPLKPYRERALRTPMPQRPAGPRS